MTVEISGATANTYVLVQEDVGTAITATASYTDNDGTLESVTSSSTSTIAKRTTVQQVSLLMVF